MLMRWAWQRLRPRLLEELHGALSLSLAQEVQLGRDLRCSAELVHQIAALLARRAVERIEGFRP